MPKAPTHPRVAARTGYMIDPHFYAAMRRTLGTSAEDIARLLDNDGTRWTCDMGTLDDLVRTFGGIVQHRSGRSSDEWRAVFPDGSVITASGGAWDIGYAECWCWQGNGHEHCSAAGED
jgi:hypothetical protein